MCWRPQLPVPQLRSDPIDTSAGGTATGWRYAAVGGGLPIKAEDMPRDADAWQSMQLMDFCWARTYLPSAHWCRRVDGCA